MNIDDRIVVGTLDELYEYSRSGSKNITKHIIVRHGQTFYNPYKIHDFYGNLELDNHGLEQVALLTENLKKLHTDEVVVVLSPLTRTWQTAYPYLQTFLKKTELTAIKKAYDEIQIKYQYLCDKEEIQVYLQDPKAGNLHKLHDKLYVDFRITDIIVPEFQDQKWPAKLTTSKATSEKITVQ